MKLIEEKGDLFELDRKYTLAHCVSVDNAWGAGIALEFRKRFGEAYLKCCEVTEKVNTPNVILCRGYVNIAALYTKDRYYEKPTYKSITRCIDGFAKLCKQENIKFLAMPRIGCGLDRLEWNVVKQIIEDRFKNLDIEIIIRNK